MLVVLVSTLSAFSEIDEGGIKGIVLVRRESEALFLQTFDLAVNDDEAGVQKATQERAWQHKQKEMNAYACNLCSQITDNINQSALYYNRQNEKRMGRGRGEVWNLWF